MSCVTYPRLKHVGFLFQRRQLTVHPKTSSRGRGLHRIRTVRPAQPYALLRRLLERLQEYHFCTLLASWRMIVPAVTALIVSDFQWVFRILSALRALLRWRKLSRYDMGFGAGLLSPT